MSFNLCDPDKHKWGHFSGPYELVDSNGKVLSDDWAGIKRCMICRLSKNYNMLEEKLPPYVWEKNKCLQD